MVKTLQVGEELKRHLLYFDQLPQSIFGSLASVSRDVLQCYQSDWYHDALFLKKVTDAYVKLKGDHHTLILDYFYRGTGTHLIISHVTESLFCAQYNDFGVRVTIKPHRSLPEYYDVVCTRLLIQQRQRGSAIHAEFA